MSEIIEKFLLHKALLSSETVIEKSERIYEFYDLRIIGEGASCCTYLAVDQDKHNVVMKEFFPQRFRHLFERQDDGCLVFKQGLRPFDKERIKKQRDAFIREYLWQIEIQKHNSFTGGNRPALYVSGDSLYNVMSYDGSQLSLNDAVSFANECLSQTPTVDYARLVLSELRNYAMELAVVHDMGCVVSDIKPGNVLMTKTDFALSYRRMIDYGSINKLSDINNLADGQVLDPSLFSYTQQFAAPEVIRRQYSGIGPWSDVYSFGMTVLSFLLGNIIENPSVYLSCTLDNFREILLFNDCCGTLSGKDTGFITRLYNFCRYTLATEVMKADIAPDEAFMLMQSQGTQEIKRIRSMRCVIRMLDALLDDIGTGTNEPEVRQRAAAFLKKFQDNSYGMPGERENNALLFSEKLLPVLTFGDESFPCVSLVERYSKYSLISGAFHSVYIEGKSGSGKTTALQYLACQTVGLENGPIPVWISLYDLFMSGDGNRTEQLRQYISDRLFGSAAYDETAELHDEELDRFLTGEGGRPRLLLIFDGLNEAAMCSSDVSDWLTAISEISGKSNVISVISGHDQTQEFRAWKGSRMNVLSCSRSVAEEYLADLTGTGRLQWHPDQLRPEMVERTMSYLDTPMLLHYFAVRYLDIPIDETQLPRNKALLIEQYLTALGRNCAMQKIHRTIAGESMQTDIPYGDFLVTYIAGCACFGMMLDHNYTTNVKGLHLSLDHFLHQKKEQDGTMVRSINGKFISQSAYDKMTNFDSEGNGSGSWISYLFVSRAPGVYTVIHETVGVYLAARFLVAQIKDTGKIIPPDTLVFPDLPDELIEMTAMLLNLNDMRDLKKGFRNFYGGRLKQYFFTIPSYEISDSIHEVLNARYRKYDPIITGHNYRRIVNKMDNLSRADRFKLLWGIPDDRAENAIHSFLSHQYTKGNLTDEEKNKLGTAMRKVASQPEVLAVARMLSKKDPHVCFKSDMDILNRAKIEICEIAGDFLEKEGIDRSFAAYSVSYLVGIRAFKMDLNNESIESIETDVANTITQDSSANYSHACSTVHALHSLLLHLPMIQECPRLYNIFAANLILILIREAYNSGKISEWLTFQLPDELLYEISRVVFTKMAENHIDFYPEKWHADLLSTKPEVFKTYSATITAKTEFPISSNKDSTYTELVAVIMSQFCAVEYELLSGGSTDGFYRVSEEQLNVLTQVYVIMNYAMCDGHIGRMADNRGLRFENALAGKVICEDGVSANGKMNRIIPMMALGMYSSIGLGEYFQFKWRYLRDYRFLNLTHIKSTYIIKTVVFIIISLLLSQALWYCKVPALLMVLPLTLSLSQILPQIATRIGILIYRLISQTVHYFKLNKVMVRLVLGILLSALGIYIVYMMIKVNYYGYRDAYHYLKDLLHF